MSQFFAPVVAHQRSGGVSVTLLRQNESWQLPNHGHEHAFISLLVAGSYRERIGSREIDQQAPCVMFHPPGMEHIDAYGPGGAQMLTVEVPKWWVEQWSGVALQGIGPAELRGDGVLPAVWDLYRCLAANAPADPLQIEERTGELLAEVLRPRQVSESSRPQWLGRVVERLRSEYAAPPSMRELARESGVHPAHLSRIFRKYEGCTPMSFVQRERVRHVWDRLTGARPGSLAELALEAGFSDQSHCTRVFRRVVGAPPGVFGRHLGGGPVEN